MIDSLHILIIVGIILIGMIGYLHYIVYKLQDEVKSIWLQIAIVAAATAKEFTKMQEQNKNNNE